MESNEQREREGKRLQVWIAEHLHKQLLAKAQRERRTLTAVVEMALEAALAADSSASSGGASDAKAS